MVCCICSVKKVSPVGTENWPYYIEYTMGCFVRVQASLSRQLRIHVVHVVVLLVFVWLANVPCSYCSLVTNDHASATAVRPLFNRQREHWNQYRDNINSQIAPGRHRGRLAAAIREMNMTTTAKVGHTIKVSVVSNSTRAPPHTEVEALAALKAAITSDPLSALRSWVVGAGAVNESNACSRWVGVTCSPQFPNHVVALNLSTLQLEGSLNSVLPILGRLPLLQSLDLSVNSFRGSIQVESLTNLSHITYFDVSWNVITGGIPSEIAELADLQHLDVSQNKLNGLIPTSLGNCSLLRSIYVGGNALQGGIPASLGALSGLENLNMSHNSLSGSIPSSLGNCSSLRLLDLNFNTKIASVLPHQFSMLKQLQILFLDNVPISGAFPPWIANLTSLTRLALFGNNLQGEIPDSIGQLEFLWEISLYEITQVSGVIPLSIGNLTSLMVFEIFSSNVSGPVPPNIGMLPNLFFLNLEENYLLTGVIPSSLANCSSLLVLEFGFNTLMDPEPIPPWIESLTSLTGLYLSSMNLHGEFPQYLGKLSNLEYFEVAFNNLTGKIPSGLQNCTYLSEVDVSDNPLTGGLPPELGELIYMTRFLAIDNYFTGSFPEFVVNWTQIILFDVQNNQLSGLIDGSGKFYQLQQLAYFDAESNNFEGPLPETIGNCSELAQLYVGGNHLSGTIPASVGNLTNLIVFNIEDNDFEGPIPVNLLTSNLQLNVLDLGQNNLEGSIPWEIGQLVELSELWLFNNKLTGIVPSSLGNCSKMGLLDLSGNQFEGNIPAAAISQMSGSLTSLNLSRNLFSGSWPAEFAELIVIQAINVSSNNISGSIPLGLRQCTNLNSLDISTNNLTGGIPQDLGLLTHLEFFNASFNNFVGPIPHQGIFNSNRINESSFLGNPGLCGLSVTIGLQHQECTAIPLNVSTHDGHCKAFSCHKLWIPIAVVSTLVLLGAVCTTAAIKLGCIRYRGGNSKKMLLNFGATRFSKKDVLQTIDDPSSDNIIGVGASSIVYKGVLPGGQTFALKRLLLKEDSHVEKDSSVEGAQCDQLVKEANILAKLRHKNIVKFLGFYSSLDHKALILEYMSEGSLHKHLHEVEEIKLPWQTRLNIAMRVAQGMKYLHHDLLEPIIHGDLKPSNVFLDADFEPKVGDFGVSKFVGAQKDGKASASTFCGTIGYMPPEYASQVWVSTEGDVYSYGMVVLELLTRRQPCSLNDLEDQRTDLRSWALKSFQEGPFELLDQSLVKDCNSDNICKEQMMYLLRVGLFCTRGEPQSRPSMIDVVGMLMYIMNLGVEHRIRRTIEELANDIDPSIWVTQDPAVEGAEFNSS